MYFILKSRFMGRFSFNTAPSFNLVDADIIPALDNVGWLVNISGIFG